MASRDSRDAHQNISRPWICVSFRSSLSTPSKPGLLEFGKDLRKLFDYLDFFVFHLDLSLSIFVLLWRPRFFVNGWISVVKKLLPQDNTRDTKEFVTTSNSQLTQETDKFIKKIVNTEETNFISKKIIVFTEQTSVRKHFVSRGWDEYISKIDLKS